MNKLHKELLKKELLEYSNLNFKKHTFSQSHVNNLLESCKEFGMTESMYCCHGEESCCWQELYEDGVWNFSLQQVENEIRHMFKIGRKYLYNSTKYGNRFYVGENDEYINVFIYLRDKIGSDYTIWFKKGEIE